MNGLDLKTREYYSKIQMDKIWENIILRNHPFKKECVYECGMSERGNIPTTTIDGYFSKLHTYNSLAYYDVSSEKLGILKLNSPYKSDKLEILDEFRDIEISDKISRLFYGNLKKENLKIPSIFWDFEDDYVRVYVKPEFLNILKNFK